MFGSLSAPTRRGLIVAAAAVGAPSVFPSIVRATSEASEGGAIRPFRVDVREEALVDLRRRIVMNALARPGNGCR